MIIGIDPGQSGGVAGVDMDGDPVFAVKMPIADKKVDVIDLILRLDLHEPDRVWIESQTIMARQKGAMAIGANFGRVMASVEYLRLRHKQVTPTQWNKAIGIPAGLKGRAKKEASYAACGRLWGRDFDRLGIRPAQDGLYEALLIARYGWTKP